MKSVRRFLTYSEAEIALGLLKDHGIDATIVGAKEYSSFVTGQDFGNYELLVANENLENAQDLIRKIDIQPIHEPAAEEVTTNSPKSYLKRAVLFAVMAVFILPIAFNIVSLINLRHYLQNEKSSSRFSWLLFILLLNLASVFAIMAFLKIWGWQYIRNLQ